LIQNSKKGRLSMDGVYLIDDIKGRLRPVFEASPVYRAILFGSYAKGLATEQSDVDIVVDGRGELRGLGFYGVLDDVATALSKKVDLIEISEIRQDSPILNEIEDHGVLLYERER
jgi:predicted nucleotidyltransferase